MKPNGYEGQSYGHSEKCELVNLLNKTQVIMQQNHPISKKNDQFRLKVELMVTLY